MCMSGVEFNEVVSLCQVTVSNCFPYPEKAALLHTPFCSLTPRHAQGLIVLDYIDSLLILHSPSARQKDCGAEQKDKKDRKVPYASFVILDSHETKERWRLDSLIWRLWLPNESSFCSILITLPPSLTGYIHSP